jgi:hypothetical protein
VNATAWQLVARLRKSLEIVPGATSAAIFEGRTWTLIELIAASNDSVYTIALRLGMKPPTERKVIVPGGHQSWLFATAEHLEPGRGIKARVTVSIIGPRNTERLVPS